MIRKEKNIIYFTTYNGKSCRLDINTGKFYAKTERPVKTFPAGFKTALKEYNEGRRRRQQDTWVMTLLTSLCNYSYNSYYVCEEHRNNYDNYSNLPCSGWHEFADLFRVADKLDAINVPNLQYSISNNDADALRFIDKHFKDFVKYYKEHDKNTDIHDFYNEFQRIIWERTYEKSLRNINPEIKNLIYKAITSCIQIPDEMMDLTIYFFSHGVAEFYGIFPNGCTSRYNHYSSDANNALRVIKDVLSKAKEMNFKVTKDNFFAQAIAINKMYNIYKDKISIEKLKNAYNVRKDVLSFEDDEYIVVIPQNEQDFIQEANQQNNCVYSSYYPQVIDQRTFVVFIRRKDNINKSYVTCEVNQSGTIVQYLTTNNYPVRDDGFKFKYSKHLSENW